MPRGQFKIELVGGDTASRSWAVKELARLESLGIFGSNNDFNNFNPDVKPSDIAPTEEDFIRVPFRLLSATTVAAGTFRATSFPASVLRAGLNKFINIPIFPNHDQEVGNELGIIESVKFVNSKTTKEDLDKKRPGGLKIPAGVEGILKIDAKANPKTARSILNGFITSLSVTVDFEWEPSHKLVENQTMRDWEWTIGQMGSDGKMITRKATKIRDVYEASLVWLGADPFAKAVDESGELVNIDTTNAVEFDSLSFAGNTESSYNKVADLEKRNYLSSGNLNAIYSYRRELGTGLRELDYEPDKNKLAMKEDVLALLLTLFSVDKEENLTKEMIEGFQLIKGEELTTLKGKETELATAKTELIAEKGKVTSKTEELNTANNKIAELKKEDGDATILKAIRDTLSKIIPEEKDEEEKVVELTAAKVGDVVRGYKEGSESYKAHVEFVRTETKKLYALSAGDKPEDAIVSMLDNAKLSELQALAKTYGQKAIGQFSGTCKDCNSTNITLQSSVTGEPGGGAAPVMDTSSAAHLTKKFSKNSMNAKIEVGNQ